MKKMVSVLLAITLVLSSIAVSLTAFTLAAPAEANGADPNLAKDYTHANGAVSWDDAAGAWGGSNIDSKTNSVYGGYSWRFGVPESTGHITVNATALEADTTYYFSYLYSKDKSCCILTDCSDHLVEHCEAFNTVLDNRISLSVASEIDTALEFFHCVNVIHPLCINDLQQTNTLNLTHIILAEHLFTLGIECIGSFL